MAKKIHEMTKKKTSKPSFVVFWNGKKEDSKL
jgi:hypothetical protein